MNNFKNYKILALLIFIIFFIFNLFILSDYGIIWDESIHDIRGQAYLQYFLTGDGDKKADSSRISVFQNHYYGETLGNFSYWIKNDSGHPPLNGILASLTNYIFFQKLGVIGDIEGYHLFILFTSSLLVALVFLFAAESYGLFAGLVAFLSISLYPLFFGEAHFNIKDPVEAFFYTGALYGFYKGVTRNSWKWIMISALFAGMALGTKFNILFIIFTIFPWIFIYKWKILLSKKWPFSLSMTKSFIAYPLIVLGLFYATWPFLWKDTWDNFLKIALYYKDIGLIAYQPSKYLTFFNLNTFPVQWILYTTPLVILFFFILGCIYAAIFGFREKNKTAIFILLFFIVPLGRVMFPGTGIYGGVRQIMEYIPAMAILAGIGASMMVTWLHGYIVKRVKSFSRITITPLLLLQFIVILSFIPITLRIISLHPNENVYFNSLIGGLNGAKEKNLMYWGFSFGNVYRQGANWLNRNADGNSKLSLAMGYEDAVPRVWLRKDILYSNDLRSGLERKGEYIMELIGDMPQWPPYYYYEYIKTALEPVYEIKVDSVPILKIWKNDILHTKEEFKGYETALPINKITYDNKNVLLDLVNNVNLTELNINFSNNNCNFTNEGFLSTSDTRTWRDQPGNLGIVPFYPKFKTRKTDGSFSYIFPIVNARYIKIIHSDKNTCFKFIKDIYIKKI